MKTYRGSAAPLKIDCPQSDRGDPAEAVGGSSKASRIGQAVHAGIARFIGGIICEPWKLADEFGVGDACRDVEFLLWQARSLWAQYEHLFPSPQVEHPLVGQCQETGNEMSGHLDVFAIDGPQAKILDWKTSCQDRDYIPQCKAYAWAAMNNGETWSGKIETVWAGIAWLREGEIEGYQWTRAQLETWWRDEFLEATERFNYNPGTACTFCPRKLSCRPRQQWLAESLTMVEGGIGRLATGQGMLDILDRAASIESMCEDAREIVRQAVRDAGGRADVPGGGYLELKESKREAVDGKAAWPILLNRLGLDGLQEVAGFAKGKIEKAVGDRAAPRQKGREIKEFMGLLRDAGALREKTFERLDIRRSREEGKVEDGQQLIGAGTGTDGERSA